ncbi:MAG TPA: PQQ-dependent sugar dehydrogenase, partial [Bryobacteraceae bacterium]|nr:PQQ-dependent sugar dehydrogenase [Bryobacteraceae bacterium]
MCRSPGNYRLASVRLITAIPALAIALLVSPTLAHALNAATSDGTSSTAQAPVGIEQRTPWTTSKVVGSPDPPAPYQAERVFPKLKFKDPVDLCLAPGSDRLFLAEQAGAIYSFRPEAAVSQPDLFIALNKVIPDVSALYGIAFHPGFQSNHYVYLCYVLKDGVADGSRVSRFEVQPGDPPRLNPATEKVVITWLSGGHNGGCIKFGPDGYLYISTG